MSDTFPYYQRAMHVPGPRAQVLSTVAHAPASLTPLWAFLSDSFPLCGGLHRNPWSMIALGVAAFAMVCLAVVNATDSALTPEQLFGLWALMGFKHYAVVLTRAAKMEKVQSAPSRSSSRWSPP